MTLAMRLFTTGEERAEIRPWTQLLAVALVGSALGWIAWGQGRAPALAALLPLLLAACRTRGQAFVLGMAYTLLMERHNPAFIGSWFGNSLVIGWAAETVYVLVSGAVWSLGWSASGKPWRKALAVVVAWIVALLPPVSLGVAGHPVIAWGTILPGSGWVGVGLSVLGPATMVWLVARHRPSAKSLAAVLALLGAALCTIGFARFESPSRATPAAVGVTTEWGQNVSVDGILQRVASMGEVTRTLATQEAPTTVVWPESIIGTYNPALYPVLNIEVLSVARASGQTHIIGMDLVGDGNRYENAAVAFYPDGRTARAVARQPAPVSLWKPWRKTDTFVADWSANNVLTIGATRRAAFIFCYEEYMPFFYLLNELQGPVDLYVAMANTWAAESPEAAEIQTQHSFGMARLFGRPYIKAENRPLPSSKN
ncbi:MAG: conjugal transfer protein TraB [Hydrogenophaga sp.]|uniref:conjugal transfer protein TraB n=1 Tax=Hydrogenophaga sp. TaxID=1904254 RepID=UPI00260E98E5|nr:conjugal transfer protein TraB [Hydrogenophaga sp.]MCV0439055.1 conjugal transfer protein TraB [Hydrogenophaga sp.]